LDLKSRPFFKSGEWQGGLPEITRLLESVVGTGFKEKISSVTFLLRKIKVIVEGYVGSGLQAT
jgi:hypothetical protein